MTGIRVALSCPDLPSQFSPRFAPSIRSPKPTGGRIAVARRTVSEQARSRSRRRIEKWLEDQTTAAQPDSVRPTKVEVPEGSASPNHFADKYHRSNSRIIREVCSYRIAISEQLLPRIRQDSLHRMSPWPHMVIAGWEFRSRHLFQ